MAWITSGAVLHLRPLQNSQRKKGANMFTEIEENQLRALLRERLKDGPIGPMPVVNPKTPTSGSEGLGGYIERVSREARPLRSGGINDNQAIASALSNAGLKLTPGEAFSLGLSPSTILTSSSGELRRAVAEAQARQREQGIMPPSAIPPRQAPWTKAAWRIFSVTRLRKEP